MSLFTEKNAIVSSSARSGPTVGAVRARRTKSIATRNAPGRSVVSVVVTLACEAWAPSRGGAAAATGGGIASGRSTRELRSTPSSWRGRSRRSRTGTPETASFAMRFTPVSVYPLTFALVFANRTTAATPSEAIFSGYWLDVASMTPARTFRTPAQPPSTDTIVTPACVLPPLQRVPRAGRAGPADRVDDVDRRVLLEAVLHGCLRGRRLALGRYRGRRRSACRCS